MDDSAHRPLIPPSYEAAQSDTAKALQSSDYNDNTSTTINSGVACTFSAFVSAPSSILILILSSNLLSHDSVTWLAICIFTWMLSIVTWLATFAPVTIGDAHDKLVLYKVLYFLGLAIGLSFVAAEVRIIGTKSFDSGLFPIKELNWSITACMLLGAACSLLVADKAKADGQAQAAGQYGVWGNDVLPELQHPTYKE
ncbi:MAG: hypothetical protein LQ346_002674 [Caloplaca aetnensis]|nr:MAG: hypothetical protein LQ346_002674 [Caloplaca aetnensis]